MKKELTNEEILKVLSMNIGNEVTGWYNGLMIKSTITYSNIEGVADKIKMGYGNLLNIPLSKINDKDVLEVAEILGIVTNNILIRRRTNFDKEAFVQLYYLWDDCEKVVLNIGEGLHPFHANRNRFIEEYFGIEYLKSKGYALPLFFAPNHWANGKTAIELGLAIDATTIKAEI